MTATQVLGHSLRMLVALPVRTSLTIGSGAHDRWEMRGSELVEPSGWPRRRLQRE